MSMAAKTQNHPKELYALFFTEMWERFGYYLTLAIFVLYLNERKGMSTAEASSFYGTYIGLAYLAPLFGGFLADRVFGHRFSILLGSLAMSIGYFLLATDRAPLFYLAIGVLVVGNGLFKPNISAMVGGLYPPGDPRRDSAFSIFYFGVNLGAAFAAPAAAYLRSHYGWGAAFAAAGVGLLIGFINFAFFGGKIAARVKHVAQKAEIAAARESKPKTSPEVVRERLRALLISCAIVTFFWIAFQQNGSTLTFWARDNTDLTLHGLLDKPMDPVYFSSANSIFILTLTPLILLLFKWLRKNEAEPSTPGKIAIGMVLTACAYAVMSLASLSGGDTGRVSAGWLVSAYFVITIGELFVSPMGLSMVTRLAPPGTTALLLGVWYLASAAGNKVAGQVGVVWSEWSHHTFFAVFTVTSLFAAGLLFVQLPRLVAAMDPDSKQRIRKNSGRFWGLFGTAAPRQV